MIQRKQLLKGADVAWQNLLDLAIQRDDLKVALTACERLLSRSIGTEDAWSKQLELDLTESEEESIEEIERKIIELKERRDG